MEDLTLTCLGSQDMTPVKNNDCSHYLLGKEILIDCATSPVMNMLNIGECPEKIRYIVFTHLHADHSMGFASLLWYMSAVRKIDLGTVTVIGPKNLTNDFIDRTMQYIWNDESRPRPAVIETDGENSIQLRCNDGNVTLKHMPSHHAVPGNCYVFEKNGKKIGFSGDTFTTDSLAGFFSECDALVYECSFPASDHDSPVKIKCGHSDSYDAAQIAVRAGVKKVLLTHACRDHEQRLSDFKKKSDLPAVFLQYGDKVNI